MESIKLSHVLLVLAAIPVIVAGIICLIVGTLLMTDWTTQIIEENLSYFSDILGLFSNILGVLIDIGGAIVLAQGCAVIILSSKAKKYVRNTKDSIVRYRTYITIAVALLLLATVFNVFYWMSVTVVFPIFSAIYVIHIISAAAYACVIAYSKETFEQIELPKDDPQ